MNEYNKPMGYWIRQYSVDGMALSNPVYVDAKDVIFYTQNTAHRRCVRCPI